MFRKLAPALVVPLLLVMACANEADDGALEVRTGAAATQALRAAPDAVTAVGTAAMEMEMVMTVEGQAIEMLATGVIDAEAHQMAMELDVGALFRVTDEAGEPGSDDFDAPMQLVADGTTMYMQIPFASLVDAQEGWVSIDLAAMGVGADQLGAYDLRNMLEILRGASGEPEVVGNEEVRGVETTHYRATIDLAKALDEAPEAARAALDQLGEAGDLKGAHMDVDVWIDADGLPRRQSMDMGSIFGSLGVGDTSVTMTIEYFDYGEPVDIEVPSPDEVTPFDDITDAFGEAGE